MLTRHTRRHFLASAAVAASRPPGLLIDSHIHLFDPARFPYHANAAYRPPAFPLESYLAFVHEAKIDHTVIVHPEPYQDDHRYLEYCFAHEPSKGFFKGTCLFDPIAPATPVQMENLVHNNPGRIVALRIHRMRTPGEPPTTAGPIKDRDMSAPAMKTTWRKAQSLGLAIQMHFLPFYAAQIAPLAAEFSATPVILDHLARAGQGTAQDFDHVLQLAKFPKVYMKFSGVGYSSKQKAPYLDAKTYVRRAYDAFGPDRLVWGGLGHNLKEFNEQLAVFDAMFDFASESDRAKISGLNAKKLFRF